VTKVEEIITAIVSEAHMMTEVKGWMLDYAHLWKERRLILLYTNGAKHRGGDRGR